jgi:hypothetical protein
MKKSNNNVSAFKNTKGGALSFMNTIKAVTGTRATAKSTKTVKGEVSYVAKSAYVGLSFLAAGVKELTLKSCDVSNSVIAKADVETADAFVNEVVETKLMKLIKRTNKGKLNLGSKHRIATSRTLESISSNDAIESRRQRLLNDDMKAEAKEIKAFVKMAKKSYSDFKRADLNRIFIELAKYNNSDFVNKFEEPLKKYIETLTPKTED